MVAGDSSNLQRAVKVKQQAREPHREGLTHEWVGGSREKRGDEALW